MIINNNNDNDYDNNDNDIIIRPGGSAPGLQLEHVGLRGVPRPAGIVIIIVILLLLVVVVV